MNNVRSVKPSKEDKIRTLRAQLAELEKTETPPVLENTMVLEEKYPELKLDDMIPVMSLLPYSLNLSTREQGQGTTKKFSKFGEIKKILYKDLLEILDNHSNFMEAGYFYILSPAVISQHGLQETYSKILNKEKVENLLSLSSEECLNVYTLANEKQKEIIIQLVVDTVRDNPEKVNLNVVDKLSRLSGVEIIKRADDEREIKNITSEK